mgnify:CR=1 FL=1
MISKEYIRLNKIAHKDPKYGTAGRKNAPYVQALLDAMQPATWLDYGCGKQTLRAAVRFDGRYVGYDPAIHGCGYKEPAELVTCTDVLEHVEPDHIDAVLDDIFGLAGRAVYVVISCSQGTRVLEDGKPAHRFVKSPDWWSKRLSEYGLVEIHTPIARASEIVATVWL